MILVLGVVRERSVNTSQEVVFVESLKLRGLQKYIDTLKNFCRRAYSEDIYMYIIIIEVEVEEGYKGKSEI